MKKFIIYIFIIALLFSSCEKSVKENKNNLENNQFIGVWINYNEISSLLKSTNSSDDLEVKINEILNCFTEFKINNIFLHVRAFDDCFYMSKICQPSKYSYNSKSEFVDFLSLLLTYAHKKEIKVHAWINPFRISNQQDILEINSNTFAGEILKKNPNNEEVIISKNGIYYNPIFPEVHNYIIKVVKEIINNYNIDGLHIDDYFYPTNKEGIDDDFYKGYIKGGGVLDIKDLRRNAIDAFISSLCSLCNENDIIFSISPSVDIEKNYYEKFADVSKWCSDSGYADYIIPQIYFGFEHDAYPFDECIEKWSSLGKEANLLVGIPFYKIGNEDVYAKTGKDEWVNNTDIISRQIKTIKQYSSFKGYVYYSASYIYNNSDATRNEKENILKIID